MIGWRYPFSRAVLSLYVLKVTPFHTHRVKGLLADGGGHRIHILGRIARCRAKQGIVVGWRLGLDLVGGMQPARPTWLALLGEDVCDGVEATLSPGRRHAVDEPR